MRSPVKVDRLANGFMCYSQPHKQSNLSGIGVRVGSIHTRADQIGLPHLTEHMLARESSMYSTYDVNHKLLQYAGGPGVYNIRTDRTSTFYGHDQLLRRHWLMKSWDLFSSLLRDKVINEEGLSVERASIHQEYYLYGMDVPEYRMDDLIHGLVFPNSPAGQRIDCELEHLAKFTTSDVRRFVNKWYTPENTFAVMFGPSYQEVRKLAQKAFGDLPTRRTPSRPGRGKELFAPLPELRSEEHVMRGIHQYHVAIGLPTENYSSSDGTAIDFLGTILAHRVRQRLREENFDFNKGAYRVYVQTPRSFHHGLFYLYFASLDKGFAQEGEYVVLDEMAKLRTKLISTEEMEMVRTYWLAYSLEAFNISVARLAELVIEASCNGDEELIGLHSWTEKIRKLSRHKIIRVANKYFTGNHGRVVIKPNARTFFV